MKKIARTKNLEFNIKNEGYDSRKYPLLNYVWIGKKDNMDFVGTIDTKIEAKAIIELLKNVMRHLE